MRLLIGLAVGALAALSIPHQVLPGPERTEAREVFVGRLTHLDGVAIGHSQVKIRMSAGPYSEKPYRYDLRVECEDIGMEFRTHPARPDPEPQKGRWMSFASPHGIPESMAESGIFEPEYRCPAADPARFARVTVILNERSTLDYEADDHAEFRSSAGVVRFKWEPDPLIM